MRSVISRTPLQTLCSIIALRFFENLPGDFCCAFFCCASSEELRRFTSACRLHLGADAACGGVLRADRRSFLGPVGAAALCPSRRERVHHHSICLVAPGESPYLVIPSIGLLKHRILCTGSLVGKSAERWEFETKDESILVLNMHVLIQIVNFLPSSGT